MLAEIGRATGASFTDYTALDDGVISKAAIYVSPALESFGMVLAHEFVHALGMIGHSEPPFASVMTPWFRDDYTANDLILIATFYDPRIVPGMARGAALAAARDLIPGLVARMAHVADPITVKAR